MLYAQDQWQTQAQAGRELGISRQRIGQLIAKGSVEFVRTSTGTLLLKKPCVVVTQRPTGRPRRPPEEE